ncbi:MAG: GIY-YIG nuclease family protein [archaeon]|nr:GIY-YIG nuclease family protein [archaeon]
MVRKGTYVLFLYLNRDVEMKVGALGSVRLSSGSYCYVGSAMNGLDHRVNRHLSKVKKVHWHIDRLTLVVDEAFAYECEEEINTECSIADLMLHIGCIPAIEGFGCSDCNCNTHLFRVETSKVISALCNHGFHRFKSKISSI